MKTSFYQTSFLLLALGLVAVISTAMAHEDKDKDKEHDRYITIRKDQSHPIRPRMPARTAIDCMYEASGEALVFDFLDDMGGVAITVTNTTTGEMYFDFCSSTPGMCRTTICGDEGLYRIELEDDRGQTYTGAFEL